jgi:hypothetical protein
MSKDNDEYQPIVDLLDDIFGEHRTHNEYTGQLTYCCPCCSYEIKGLDELDDKYNLEVNYKMELHRCWVCSETHETHGNIYNLIKRFGTKKHLKQYQLLRPEDDEEYVRTYKKVTLPKDFISFNNVSQGLKLTHYYKQAFNYIRSRNITDDMIKKYNIGFCYQGDYANRIIIPSYNKDGEINYFTGRSYESKPFLKYKNPEAQKEIIIFNENLIDWDKPVFLVEGPFDSIFVDNSIPMLGKVLSEELFSILYERAKEIIIVLDPDAYSNEEKMFHKLNGGRLYGKVYVTHLEGEKDIADLKGDLSNNKPFQLD